MKTTLVLGLAGALFAVAIPGVSPAGPNEHVAIALDVQAKAKGRTCTPTYSSCAALVPSQPDSGYYDVMVVAYKFTSISAVEYSLDWPHDESWSLVSFTNCGQLQIGQTSTPPITVSQAWTSPLHAPSDSAGVILAWLRIWAGSSGCLRIIPNGDSGGLQVADSAGTPDEVSSVGFAGVGDSVGFVPCP